MRHDERPHSRLLDQPGLQVTVDLEARTITRLGADPVNLPVDAFARYRLPRRKDELVSLLEQEAAIETHERSDP